YEACEKLFREIMEQFTARNKHSKTLQAYASISANIRIHLKQYSREVQQLKNKVDDALKSKAITVEEAERRIRQIEILESKDVQLQKLYDVRTNSYASSRASLLTSRTSAFADGGTTSWAADDDNDKPTDTQVSVADLMTQQDKILQEIISNLADHMDTTNKSIVNKTQRIIIIDSKNHICCYWVVIIFLFICIITVALALPRSFKSAFGLGSLPVNFLKFSFVEQVPPKDINDSRYLLPTSSNESLFLLEML
ncbi:unnamed protein product, partial [Heterotrigona itama]